MKYVLALISLLWFYNGVKSQTIYVGQTSNTFYIDPPVSGCDGIWAIDKTQWPACAPGCVYASAFPFGCLTTPFPGCDSIVADTLFLKLCSLPCNIVASCGPGPTVICGTGTPMTTTNLPPPFKSDVFKLYPNPSKGNFIVEYDLQHNESANLRIYDLTGRIIGTYNLQNSSTTINTEMLQDGIYQYEVIINGTSAKKDKLIIIK